MSQKLKQQQDILKNYQKNLLNIIKERRRIQNALNQKYKQKKYLTQPQDNTFKSRTSLEEIQKNPRKMIKLSLQTQVQNPSLSQKQSKAEKINQIKEQDKKIQKKPQVPQAIADRNRRIFGGLTTHLKKAGQHLKSQEFKDKQRNAKEILNKLITKQKQQRQKIQNKQREEIQTQISKLQQEKRQVEEKLLKNENSMLSEIVKTHLNTVGKFNVTRSEPKVCWKPSKPLQSAQKQEKIKQISQKYLKKIQQEWISKINEHSQVIDHSNYMTQNQRQFYGNFINKMYREYNGFVLTSAEPQIFWKPKLSSNKMNVLVAETKTMLQQKSQVLKKANGNYYLSKKSSSEDQLAKEIIDQENQEEEALNLKDFDE